MIKKIHETKCGDIHYWISEKISNDDYTLMFLPGLTADHRLFDKQIAYFEGKTNVFVWDAPAHAASWPFTFDFTLENKAKWLNEIIDKERIAKPVIVGQSMGGYVGQMYAQHFGSKLCGFISIDSAPLQRKYLTSFELYILKKTELIYRWYPWKWLLKSGSKGVATTEYGRKLMYDIMMAYDGDKERYVKIISHGYKILAESIEKDLPYEIQCPALLICGSKDRAGLCIRYNKAWHKETRIPIEWIEDAGHNSNTDKPEYVNGVIEKFISEL